MIIASASQALSGSEAIFDLGNAISAGVTFIPGHMWPARIVVSTTTAIAVAAALEYVNPVLGTSTYDGIASGAALTGATMAGAYLIDPLVGGQTMIYVRPQAVQMKFNLKVHVFGASGTALIEADRL